MTSTLTDTLTILAQSLESLRSTGAPPAWAEIIGPLDRPERVQWHVDLMTQVGFVAPPECSALGSVGYGWARSLEGRERQVGLPPGAGEGCTLLAPGERRRCRVVAIVTRTGELGGYLRQGSTLLIKEPPSVGRVIDCMRRSLGLPTPPPTEPTDGLLAYLWLSSVRGAAERAASPLAWADVARLHPAVQVVADAGIAINSAQLVWFLRVASDAWSWSTLAQLAAGPGWVADILPDGAGGWMDEGILSRWLLAQFSGLRPLLDKVMPLVTPAAARKLRLTLNQLGLLTPDPNRGHPRGGSDPNT